MNASAARRVGVLAGHLQPQPLPQLLRAPCAGAAAAAPQRSTKFAGQVILITGAAKVRRTPAGAPHAVFPATRGRGWAR